MFYLRHDIASELALHKLVEIQYKLYTYMQAKPSQAKPKQNINNTTYLGNGFLPIIVIIAK